MNSLFISASARPRVESASWAPAAVEASEKHENYRHVPKTRAPDISLQGAAHRSWTSTRQRNMQSPEKSTTMYKTNG